MCARVLARMCVFACVCGRAPVCVGVCGRVHTHVCLCACVCLYECACVWVCGGVCACVSVPVHMRVHLCACACVGVHVPVFLSPLNYSAQLTHLFSTCYHEPDRTVGSEKTKTNKKITEVEPQHMFYVGKISKKNRRTRPQEL